MRRKGKGKDNREERVLSEIVTYRS